MKNILTIILAVALALSLYAYLDLGRVVNDCREAIRVAENTVSLHELAHSTSDLGQYESFLFGAREQNDRFQRLADDC